MRTFGHYLVEKGVITKEQFEEATQSRVVFGGRLGTNLAELGYLRLEDIGRHLAEHLKVPLAPEDWLNNPSAEAKSALAPALVSTATAKESGAGRDRTSASGSHRSRL